MKIVEFLRPEFVLDNVRASDKSAMLLEMCEFIISRDPTLPPLKTLHGVLEERESLRSTGIGDNVAIPHGRIAGLPHLVAAYGRSKAGIEFVGTDDTLGRFHHFVVVFAPESSAGLHLKALARITRLFKNPRLRQSILDSADGAAIYRLISEEDAKY